MTPPLRQRVKLLNEPLHRFGSTGNTRRYETEIDLTEGGRPSSIRGILIDDHPLMIVGDENGATGVHPHSLLILEDLIFFAVGAHVVHFSLGQKRPAWVLKTDEATCFGLFYEPNHDALISHGELSICRFDRDGRIFWSELGADIFSETPAFRNDGIETRDYSGRPYRFDYQTGQALS